MDLVAGLAQGFAILLSPAVLAVFIFGLVTGGVAGFLPGLSPAGGLALQLPLAAYVGLTFGLQSPVVFMVASAYGTLYGRGLAALNLNALAAGDAGPYAKPDRAVLWATLLASIIVAVAVGLLLAASHNGITLSLGPIELSAFLIFMLLGGAAFGRGSAAAALAMVVLGLLLRVVGEDIQTGIPRLTFGIVALEDGLSLVTVAIGLFVVANVIDDVWRTMDHRARAAGPSGRHVASFWPSTIAAVLAGLLPTNGATFAATAAASRSSPKPCAFDPASQSGAAEIIRATMLSDIRMSVSLIPLLLLLIPSDPMTALLRGVVNGQAMLTKATTDLTPIVWLVCATLILAHVVPLLLMIRLAKARWRALAVDPRFMAPLLIAACGLALWLLDDGLADFGIMFAFGLIGFALTRAGFDRSLLFYAFAVGGILEENIRRSLLITRGDPTASLDRPISAAFLIGGVLLFAGARLWRHQRRAASVSADRISAA